MNFRFIYHLIIILTFIFPFKESYATHAAGMDISFECVARNSTSDFYKITVSFYRDCNNSAAPGSLDIEYTSSCGSGFELSSFMDSAFQKFK